MRVKKFKNNIKRFVKIFKLYKRYLTLARRKN
jgi:hypothetical protein